MEALLRGVCLASVGRSGLETINRRLDGLKLHLLGLRQLGELRGAQVPVVALEAEAGAHDRALAGLVALHLGVVALHVGVGRGVGVAVRVGGGVGGGVGGVGSGVGLGMGGGGGRGGRGGEVHLHVGQHGLDGLGQLLDQGGQLLLDVLHERGEVSRLGRGVARGVACLAAALRTRAAGLEREAQHGRLERLSVGDGVGQLTVGGHGDLVTLVVLVLQLEGLGTEPECLGRVLVDGGVRDALGRSGEAANVLAVGNLNDDSHWSGLCGLSLNVPVCEGCDCVRH